MIETEKVTRARAVKRRGPTAARNESALLISPLDSKHIVGVEEVTLPDGTPAVSARVSFDGGVSWRESWPLPAGSSWSGVVGPVLAIDAHGTLNLAVLALETDRTRASLVVYLSQDGGIHWSYPSVVMRGEAACSYSIATDMNPNSPFRGNVYLATDMDNTLCFARSSDGECWNGKGDARPGMLLPGLSFNPEVLVDARGSVHVVWMTGPAGYAIRAASSADGGNEFHAPVTVAEGITIAQEGLPETVPATCITGDGAAVCVWSDDREGRSRIYFRHSLDTGRTWQGPPAGAPLVSDSEPNQHEFQPHLIVTPGGEILCAFYEYGPKPPDGELLIDLAMAISYDRGATFGHRMVLSEQPWDPADDKPLSRAATRGALGWLALG
ncbi:MAG TPA: sialidase family protein [Bryobacteraceae bacterium]|nr:sialidase family protein [Bryobacteraceae bacterium]